jgi:putative ABC transport system ATP-binding protein
MNIIGLLDRPTHGKYTLNGRYITRFTQNQAARIRRDSVGFIFQSFNLLPKMTVLDNVALPLTYKGMTVSKRLKTASNMLERDGMQQREYFLPSQLSGGQAQCAAIARALVNNPKLIIADEPTGNLDSAGSRLVMELLSEVHKMGNTVLFVTHNPELTRYATRVVYMRDGTIVHDEKTKLGEVSPTARRIMYNVPETTEDDDLAGVSTLMAALPTKIAPKTRRKVSRKSRAKSTARRGGAK